MTKRALAFPIGTTLEGTFEIKELLYEDRDGQAARSRCGDQAALARS